jgi:hypothetical protein
MAALGAAIPVKERANRPGGEAQEKSGKSFRKIAMCGMPIRMRIPIVAVRDRAGAACRGALR